MKLLHTADWHVGRTLRGRSRAEEHRAVLREIAQIAESEHVDLALVAGDLFDASTPTAEAEEIVYNALLDLARACPEVVVIAGNHDHPQRLEAVAPLLNRVKVRTCATVARPDDGGVLDVTTSSGRVRIAMIPFLSQRQALLANDLMEKSAADQILTYRDRCAVLIKDLCLGFDASCVNVALAHLNVEGGKMGGGERLAHTVFEYYVAAQCFPSTLHYAALGHLHAPQRIAGPCPIWYSGSPIQLDFGETQVENAVLIAEANPGTPAEVKQIALRSGRKLRNLRGTLGSLRSQAENVGDDYIKLTLEEPPRVGLADEARSIFPNAVDVVLAQASEPTHSSLAVAEEAAPRALFAEYLKERNSADPLVLAAFDELMERLHATA